MKFSIIIPVFNAQERLYKVTASIAQLIYKDYEVIFVCDSCKDNSADFCRYYAKNYGLNAKVYEVNFGNDGLTRNYGIEHAEGEYILFIDDDDYFIHPWILEGIAGRLEALNNPDVLRCGFVWGNFEGKDVVMQPYSKIENGIHFTWCNVWSKVWKRSYIGDTRFPNVYSVSDYEFTKLMMEKPHTVAEYEMPIIYYNYMRKGSITERSKRGEES